MYYEWRLMDAGDSYSVARESQSPTYNQRPISRIRIVGGELGSDMAAARRRYA